MAAPSELKGRLSIVVPVYQSAAILPKLVAKVDDEMRQEGWSDQFELVLVNDGSTDSSWDVIRALAAQYPFVRGFSLRRNVGQHNAIMAGLHQSQGEFVVVMDDDLQHPPQAIGDMVRALSRGYDVCYTNYLHRQHVWWKKWGSWLNDWVATRLLDKPSGLYLSSFKAIRQEVVQQIIQYDGAYTYVDGLILDVTRSITTLDIEHQARAQGEGNYTLRRSLDLYLKMATSFSIIPLRMASYAGIALAMLSLVLIGMVVAQKITHPELPAGWASLIATILLVGGIQTLCLGIMGEYLGRTYLKLNRKPQFVIGSTTEEGSGA